MTPERNIPELDRYSIALIKPDAFRDHLSECIVADLEEQGLTVIHRKEMKLDRPTAAYVYEEHKDGENFPFMVESLLLKDNQGEQLPCMLLLLRADTNALDRTRVAKGRADKSGIRAKYRMYFWYELEEMGYSGADLKHMLARNRLHVPDDYERMIEVIGVLLNEGDISRLREIDVEAANFLHASFGSECKSLISLNGKGDGIK